MHHVTLIRGDGIGYEVTEAARRVIDASGVRIAWEICEAGAGQIEVCGKPLPDGTLDSVRRNRVALKGPVTTPIGTGFRSVNVELRKALDLYANLRPAKTLDGIPSRYQGVDLVVVRENTEDLYMGVEHPVGKDAAESIKIITRAGCERIARFAFDYALRHGRRRVTAVHKANIMKLTDGLFLQVVREVAAGYPQIAYDERIVDAMCMQLVQRPEDYDLLLCPNLYGDILSDLCAGLVGGLGVAPSANIGREAAVFEAIHGSAPEIAGQNIANPTALILSGVMMLRHLGEEAAAARIEQAVLGLLREGREVTADLGGTLSTDDFTCAVIDRLSMQTTSQ